MPLNSPSDAACVGLPLTELITYYDLPWPGPQGETPQALQRICVDVGLKAPRPWLILPEALSPDEGDPSTAGAPPTLLRTLSGRLTIVAMAPTFDNWQPARVRARLGGVSITPPASRARSAQGGLSGWRRKRVTDYIEEHLAEAVRLSTLAALVDLSPYHFVRAFRQSFGVPPHRYHIGRRIERAKTMLAGPANSVTAIARSLGFAETSSFSATFRRVTGCSPSQYRRCGG